MVKRKHSRSKRATGVHGPRWTELSNTQARPNFIALAQDFPSPTRDRTAWPKSGPPKIVKPEPGCIMMFVIEKAYTNCNRHQLVA